MKPLILACLATFGFYAAATTTAAVSCGPALAPQPPVEATVDDRVGRTLADGFYRGVVAWPASVDTVAGEVEMRVIGRRGYLMVATPHGPYGQMLDLMNCVAVREYTKFIVYLTEPEDVRRIMTLFKPPAFARPVKGRRIPRSLKHKWFNGTAPTDPRATLVLFPEEAVEAGLFDAAFAQFATVSARVTRF